MSISIITPYEIALAAGLEFYPSAGSPILTRLAISQDSYTKLLLHCDGADGSTTFTDETGKTVTPNGNAQIDTAQSKFGGASGLFDGAGDYLSVPDHDDWALGAGDYTIDLWYRPTVTLDSAIIDQYVDANNFWQVTLYQGSIYFFHKDGGVVRWYFNTTASVISLGITQHIAIVASGSTPYIFVDGASKALTITTVRGTLANLAAPLHIGRDNANGRYFNGWMDEIRVSKGIARWTANFATPTAEYSNYATNSPAATHKYSVAGASIDNVDACIDFLENVLGGTGIFTTAYGYSLNGGAPVTGKSLAQLGTAIKNAAITRRLPEGSSLEIYVNHTSDGAQQAESAYGRANAIGGGLHVIDPVGGGSNLLDGGLIR